MADRVILSIKDDGTHTQSFVIMLLATTDKDNPSGIPSWDAQNGKWRKDLTDAVLDSKFSRDAIRCTANDANAFIINERWRGAMTFQDDMAEAVFLKHLITSKVRERVSEIHADWKMHQRVPPDVSKLQLKPADSGLILSPYQQVPAVCSTLLPGYGLLMDPGTGKTAVVVSRICTSAEADVPRAGHVP
jgi:hypothetical protein